MRAKELEAWLSRNIGKGGKRPSYDPFNKAKKGSERNPTAQEYASSGVKEYHTYSETKDTRKETDEKKDRDNGSGSSQSSSSSGGRSKSMNRTPTNLVQNVISRVVSVVVGGVMVVSGYQEIKANEEARVLAAHTVTQVEWVWNDDNTSAIAELFNAKGNLVLKAPAVITVTRTDATCNAEGNILYTATATYSSSEDEVDTYTDTRTETLAPTGHDFDGGKETILENGKTATVFECKHCHEKFTISFDPPKED